LRIWLFLLMRKRLIAEGAYGHYGMYEAIDYTPERIPLGEKKGIVKSYMAHHQGMKNVSMPTLWLMPQNFF